jgi:hypothetical protein
MGGADLSTYEALHGDDLDAADQRRLSASQGDGPLALLLLASPELFPGASGFFLADLQLSAHLPDQFFGSALLRTDRLDRGRAVCPSFSLCLQLTFELGQSFLSLFLLMPSFEKPALEFALRRCAQTLKLDHGMKQVRARCGQVLDLPGHLSVDWFSGQLVGIVLQPMSERRYDPLPMGRQILPSFKGIGKATSPCGSRCLGARLSTG